jgi:N-glycosylase/DNA lyase
MPGLLHTFFNQTNRADPAGGPGVVRLFRPADHRAEGPPSSPQFPGPQQLAQVTEADLRACKMGFRAPYLRAAAKAVASGELDLNRLSQLSADQARAELIQLPGVGPKIANCVLLFAYGFQEAFPVDVWISKALRELYFPGKRVKQKRLERFSQTHFGRYAGFAQQYLFHYMRTRELTANRLQPGARSA